MTKYTYFIRNTAYTGTTRRLAAQQVGYDHTKKINCGSANCSSLTEYHSLLAPDEFNVILRKTTDEFNVILRTTTDEFNVIPKTIQDRTRRCRILPNTFVRREIPTMIMMLEDRMKQRGLLSYTGWDSVSQTCLKEVQIQFSK